jgi:hypothetical protein
MKKEATKENTKRLDQKTVDEKRGNLRKCKGAHSKDLWWKKRQSRKTQRGSFKRPPMKIEATLKNAKGLILYDEKKATPKNAMRLIQKTSDEKEATPKNTKGSFKRPLTEKEAIIAKVQYHLKVCELEQQPKGASS